MASNTDTNAKAAAAAQELRALIREAHEAAQMLRETMREARVQVDDYLAASVQQAMNDYTAQLQAAFDVQMKSLYRAVGEHREDLRAKLQAIADGHDQVFVAMALLTDATFTEPREGRAARRAKMLELGNELSRLYAQHGLMMRQTSDLDPDTQKIISDMETNSR